MAGVKGMDGARALNLALAALAGLSVAFALFALPDWRFDQAVGLSGLPLLLPAAQPPLGLTARLAAMAAGGAGAFLFVWLLLRALDKPSAPRRAAPIAPAASGAAPLKLRRADRHPDAPAFRPLFAGAELGEPAPGSETPQAPSPQPAFEAAGSGNEVQEASLAALAGRLPEVPDGATASISHLMQRLELGLLRRRPRQRPVPTKDLLPADAPAPLALDARLRSAIEDLQRLAARGS